MLVHGEVALMVDLASNGEPLMPATVTLLGPTFAPEELAGMKLLALIDRAAARDFADVYALAQRYGRALLWARALQLDAGLDGRYLAAQLRQHRRLRDDDFPATVHDLAALRAFSEEWADELGPPGPPSSATT